MLSAEGHQLTRSLVYSLHLPSARLPLTFIFLCVFLSRRSKNRLFQMDIPVNMPVNCCMIVFYRFLDQMVDNMRSHGPLAAAGCVVKANMLTSSLCYLLDLLSLRCFCSLLLLIFLSICGVIHISGPPSADLLSGGCMPDI